MSEFQSGDVVKLKSGGPEMTVSHYSVNTASVVFCKWFYQNEVKSDSFEEAMLEKAFLPS